ncbi:hypothetical protein FHX48_002039 [Microbacterium halimionae]|uniref:4-amino-4-deoxy-L-arabinose transferase n=1 Tax=Microbacterium halimionae TaxID=1526413 RepID=A0A7W3PLV1_9MICO|nr:hypothetical protein [Microbacterium halimionae]MBA8816945.1 hypothetical protein [Microbacterium halimionae]NII94516.1 hypothetical protein [Microbacterium halimionae]
MTLTSTQNVPTDGSANGSLNARERMPWRVFVSELLGYVLAAALGVYLTAHVAATREELFFFDGDSLFNALFMHSLATGAPQDWAMSPVLFVPELAAYALAAAFGGDTASALLINSVLNFLALYGAFRLASGCRQSASAPILSAWAAYGAFCLIALFENGGDRDSSQLASLMATTTYYSATVVASIAALGLVRRSLEAGRLRARASVPLIALVVLSCFSNPLFVAWAVAPLVLVMVIIGIGGARRHLLTMNLLFIVCSTVVGLLLRNLFSGTIVAQMGFYIRTDNARGSFAHYLGLASAEWHRPLAVVATIVLISLAITAMGFSVVRLRGVSSGVRLVALFAWLAPLTCFFGFVLVGSESPRYLQPLVFAPVLAAICLVQIIARPRRREPTSPRPGWTVLLAVVALGGMLLSLQSVQKLSENRETASSASLQCVVGWVNATHRTGAGQFWSIRAPKAYIDDPSQLLQVTWNLRPYAWLVNRDDFNMKSASFLIVDAQSHDFELPVGWSLDSATQVGCGRYTIYDFGPVELPITGAT